MKALKVLAIALITAFGINAAVAQPHPHKKPHHRKAHHHVRRHHHKGHKK